MTLKPYEEKTNDRSFSIGISKKLPEESANLAFASSPKIKKDNLSIINRYKGYSKNAKDYNIFYADEDMLLKMSNGVDFVSTSSIEITDEFTIKKSSNESVEPLFYESNLMESIKGLTSTKNIVKDSIPYVYGYETRTLEQLKATVESNDKDDITPLISVVSITDSEGNKVEDGYKVRLIRVSDQVNYENDAYQVRIYNSFDKDKTYRATYRTYTGAMKTEIINSTPIFTKLPEVDSLSTADMMDKVYAVKENGITSSIFAPSDMYKISDDIRIPHRFRYRIFGNINIRYGDSNRGSVNIGVISFERGDGVDDTRSIAADFVKNDVFPEYIDFINPHPPSIYYGDDEQYLEDPNYWQIDISMPQTYLNDYDVIIITGYGAHDLSAYNPVLAEYLEQGGNILIDNLSNNRAYALDISFGSEEPIFEYDYLVDPATSELVVNNSTRELNENESLITRHYDLTTDRISRIAYIEDGSQISPEFVITTSSPWQDLIRYTTDAKAIGYSIYKNRGKVYFSNSGLTKAFTVGNSLEAQKFIVNAILTIAEDKWVATPWITDRVYHGDNLYDEEIELMNYEYGMSINNKPVAKKIIGESVKEVFGSYTRFKYYNQEGTYFINAQEYDNKVGSSENEWIPLNKVYMPTQLAPEDKLYAYALSANQSTFNINSLQGYSKSDIKLYNETVEFNYIVRPFTYIWIDNNGSLERVKLEGSGDNISELKGSISSSDGFINMQQLSAVLPELPSGTYWSRKRAQLTSDSVESLSSNFIDKKDIFFEVKLGYYSNGEFIQGNQDVTLTIYDKITGEYKYSNDGSSIISYNELFDLRSVQTSLNTFTTKRNSEDIFIQAFTSKYSLAANKRIFAIKQEYATESDIQLPESLNTNENWHPRIKHLNFIKGSFTKEDYKKISDTLRFKFDKDYILDTLTEFYGNNPGDQKVLEAVSKLNNNDTLDAEDWDIISEAFDLIDNSSLYEYNMKEYNKQAWDPAQPIKKATKETAKYINPNTIKLQYRNVFISQDIVEREVMERMSSTVFRSNNLNWLPSESVVIEVVDLDEIGGYRVIDPSTYTIDFSKGIVTTDMYVGDSLIASYSHSNLELYKKLYSNESIALEECQRLDAYHYDIPSISSDSRVLKNPSPIVYFSDTYSELEKAIEEGDAAQYMGRSYNIDYDRGFIIVSTPTTKRVFIKYSYEQVERITIKDYDGNNSIIELNENIHFNDNILATYYYEDDYYDYKGYQGEDRFIYLDMNPNNGHVCTVSYIDNNEVVYKDIPTYDMIGKEVYFYMMPSKVMKISNASKEKLVKISETEYQLSHGSIVSNASFNIEEMLDEKYINISNVNYTLDEQSGIVTFLAPRDNPVYATYSYYDVSIENESTIRHTFDYEELKLIQLAHPEAIILGSMKITNEYSKADITLLDTRNRGGGLKESVSKEEIEKTDSLSLNFWDISNFDGPTYYGDGITIIKIPNTVLRENGGLFTKSEVDAIVNKHLALGVMPIIDYYEKE